MNNVEISRLEINYFSQESQPGYSGRSVAVILLTALRIFDLNLPGLPKLCNIGDLPLFLNQRKGICANLEQKKGKTFN